MTLEEHLAVPYLLRVESVRKPDGDWVRRAAYPELPGCMAEAYSPVEAIDKLEELRRRQIGEMFHAGEPIPVPRSPLRSASPAPDPDRLGFARWLADQRRIRG